MDKIFHFVFAITIVAVFSSAGDALAQRLGCEWGHGPGIMGSGYGMGWFGPLLTIGFWIAVVVGAVFLIRWLVISTRTASDRAPADDSALAILKERYARGEIDKEEFEAKKRDLL
jgi:putative membrane protein